MNVHLPTQMSKGAFIHWIWLRGGKGFRAGPQILSGADQMIVIKELALELPLSAIYAGLPPN